MANPNWKKGMLSPSPNGRPKGIKNNSKISYIKAKELLDSYSPELVLVAIKRAIDPDHCCVVSLKLCIDKLIPNLKAIEITDATPKYEGLLTSIKESIVKGEVIKDED